MSNVVAFGQARPDRFPPASIETEAAVLGTLLLNPTAYPAVSNILRPEHFIEPMNRRLYEAIEAVSAAGQAPTFFAINAAVGPKLSALDMGGITVSQYMANIAANSGPAVNVADHARIVRDYWALREIESVAVRASEGESYVASDMLSAVLDRVDEVRTALHDRERRSVSAGNAAADLVEKIEQALQGHDDPLPSTGLERLDDVIGGGLHPGTVVVVAGRTSMGKSVLGCEIADAVCRRGYGVVYHTLEMGRDQVVARVMSSRLQRRHVRVPYSQILRKRGLDIIQAERIVEVARDLRAAPLQIEEGGNVTIGEIAATSERRMSAFERQGIKPGVVVIDHAHLVRSSRHYNREDERIREVTNGAVGLAKKLGCAVVLLAQLNRQTEGREDKRPTPSDLRGSGSLEEDADTVIFLYRAAYYVERSPAYRAGEVSAQVQFDEVRNDLELIVDKNRQGKSNQVVKAWISPAFNAIRDLS